MRRSGSYFFVFLPGRKRRDIAGVSPALLRTCALVRGGGGEVAAEVLV